MVVWYLEPVGVIDYALRDEPDALVDGNADPNKAPQTACYISTTSRLVGLYRKQVSLGWHFEDLYKYLCVMGERRTSSG